VNNLPTVVLELSTACPMLYMLPDLMSLLITHYYNVAASLWVVNKLIFIA